MSFTNSRTNLLRDKFKPFMLITAYESELGNDYYLESHDVIDGKVMAGKPLRQETINDIVSAFFEEQQFNAQLTGIFPERLLSYEIRPGGKYRLVWYCPEQLRTLDFVPELKISKGKVVAPPMIFHVEGNDLTVYAYASSERPGPDTPLYVAPFFNCADDGDVCLGSANVQKPKERTFESLMKYWEDLFFLPKFSHVNGDDKINGMELDECYRTLISLGENATWLPNDQKISSYNLLIPNNKKVRHIL